MPLFPKLRLELDDLWATIRHGEGSEFVITRYREASQNLRTTFTKIVKRAGLTPWPKLFHNLRATRQTELAEHFPAHVVCEWMGNSTLIAAQHYLQVTDSHFARATRSEVTPEVTNLGKMGYQRESLPLKKPEKRSVSGVTSGSKVDVEGLEPPTSSV